LIRDLNAVADRCFRKGDFSQAEIRFRTALEVADRWFHDNGFVDVEILSSVTGLVRSLAAQGKSTEAGNVLQREVAKVTAVIEMLKDESELRVIDMYDRYCRGN
jgi:hypothetical protein